MSSEEVRVDKWLWAVRVYKTRALAAAACRGGHVQIDGQNTKASRVLKPGDVISARTGEITRTVRFVRAPGQRIGPKVVNEYLEDLTPASEYAKLQERRFEGVPTPIKGFGRPTKKARRQIRKILEEEL